MTPRDIEMCVMDCLQDDVMENMAALLRVLNGADDRRSWESARGQSFSESEVQSALVRLMNNGFVIPLAEQASSNDKISPVQVSEVGFGVTWSRAWFHLTQAGRTALQAWWHAEGQARYPVDEM